jgi:adenosylcobinamide kinase/adenosylcobinamide-phosphate guanylyltransferase
VASTTLVLGGARSGKSRFALDAPSADARVVFLATALAGDAEMRERIERHRAERPSHWRTVEEPFELVARVRDASADADAVLVDCLTVWVANLMLRGDPDEHVLKQADELAALVALRPATLTLVSNEVGLGVHPATDDGRHFRDLLGAVNQRVAAAVDRVVLMVAGIPLTVKDVRA